MYWGHRCRHRPSWDEKIMVVVGCSGVMTQVMAHSDRGSGRGWEVPGCQLQASGPWRQNQAGPALFPAGEIPQGSPACLAGRGPGMLWRWACGPEPAGR